MMGNRFSLKGYVRSVYDIIPQYTPTEVTAQDRGQRAFWAFPCALKVRAGRYRDLKTNMRKLPSYIGPLTLTTV